MSHYMTALAMRQVGLKPAAKIVLYWLADHHNSETGACFPSLKKLADECEMNKATVVRHLADLEARGLIARQHRHRENGSQTSTEYVLNMHEPPVAKHDSPCRKMQQPPVAKCTPHNLVNINHGNEPTPLPPKGGNGFEDFYAVFPRKKDPQKARAAYARAIKKVSPDVILSAARQYAREREGKDHQYTKHPTSWLNAGSWENQPDPSQQDFHNLVSQALGENHGLQPARQIDNGQPQRIFEALQAPRTSGRTDGFDGTARDGRGNEPAYRIDIRPKRFGGAD